MRRVTKVESWVVYQTPAVGKMGTMQVVCEEREWEKLKADNPGFTLIRSGIANEGEAERAARAGTAGLQNAPRQYR